MGTEKQKNRMNRKNRRTEEQKEQKNRKKSRSSSIPTRQNIFLKLIKSKILYRGACLLFSYYYTMTPIPIGNANADSIVTIFFNE